MKARYPKVKHPQTQIPYSDRILMARHASLAEHRNDAAQTALKIACVALNDTEGLGLTRLSRFALRLQQLIQEYYSDIDTGEIHVNRRLRDIGFEITVDGRVFGLIPDKEVQK